MDLGTFLAKQMNVAGPWNCSTMPADWCVDRGYPDFAVAWRHIGDAAEGELVARAAGGLVELWEQGIGDRLSWASDPWEAGDIAVVRLLAFEAGAVFTGQRWAIRGERGLSFAAVDQVEVVRGWRP